MDELQRARAVINECDDEIAAAFEKRMQAVKDIAAYKARNNIPVVDAGRESEIVEKSCERISDDEIRPYFGEFIKSAITQSKKYQRDLITARDKTIITVNAGEKPYDITIERGSLKRAGEILNLNRKALIVTDSGVPAIYAETLASQCAEPYIYTVPQGERSKSPETWQALLSFMLEKGFSRKDCVTAVGGGVVGDLAGFAASAYMRGIDFYNVPTTVLSQVDSSIGGKTAVNLDTFKNTVGAFYQPKAVISDADTLLTLPERQISNGLAEALKAALISDPVMFEIFESGRARDEIETVIRRSLLFKKRVVEQDEKEQGIRKILNFGHTIGHAVESEENLNGLYHGECVALGMIPMCSDSVRERLLPVLKMLNLPVYVSFDKEALARALSHDKKGSSGKVSAVICSEIGSCEIKEMTNEELSERAEIIRK